MSNIVGESSENEPTPSSVEVVGTSFSYICLASFFRTHLLTVWLKRPPRTGCDQESPREWYRALLDQDGFQRGGFKRDPPGGTCTASIYHDTTFKNTYHHCFPRGIWLDCNVHTVSHITTLMFRVMTNKLSLHTDHVVNLSRDFKSNVLTGVLHENIRRGHPILAFQSR